MRKKRLKREIQAAALARPETAARTEKAIQAVIGEWNRLDRNRERRERDHENLRGDVPIEFMAVPDPKIIPLWMNLPNFRQISKGDFLDSIFSCPYEMHEQTSNRWRNAPNGKNIKADVSVAKNYLAMNEMQELNEIVTMYITNNRFYVGMSSLHFLACYAVKGN